MKKYILTAFAFVALTLNVSFGQNMKASIGVGANPSNIRIYMLPSATGTASFSTLQFNVAIPASVTPVPTLSFVSHSFTGSITWVVDAPYIENGYLNYNINNGQSGYTKAVTAGVEFQAMELSFSGGPTAPVAGVAHLVCLPDGGVGGGGGFGGGGLFYCFGNYTSDGQSLFYARDANVVFANGDSYKNVPPNTPNRPAGSFTSFARFVPAISLPYKGAFFASKQSNDALLNWTVENQNNIVKHFEIERSMDGTAFTKIAQRNPTITNNTTVSYDLTDANVFANYKGTVYYRIKQVDLTGVVTYSDIRALKSDSKAFTANLFPNPAKDKANLVFTLDKAQPVTITLFDALGKRITDYSIQAQKGINQKQIDLAALAAGTYSFSLKLNNDTQTVSFVKSN
jgi:Secretion system C-terminal sorting domain